ncbi:MAG: biopolymer transporter ExbD [Myxococcales bacterium]|nr:biopolymer transporter ExbD [Myxococcales bacterium]
MAIRAPGARLLRDVPFRFIEARGREKRSVDAQITLVPFIDFLLTVVVFLLMSFSSSGEITVLPGLPDAEHGATDATIAPVIAIDADQVTIDGRRVADTRALLADARLARVEPLVRDLEVQRDNWQVLHPGQEAPTDVVVQVSREVDFRAVRKVLFSVTQAGYAGVGLAVRPR